MQRKLLALTFCALLSTGTASAAPAKIPQNIESYIRVEMEQEHIPALAVAIVDHGRVVTEAAYGTPIWNGAKKPAHTRLSSLPRRRN
jgi:CubicO group peptidase (beta-lactamase class C family)